MNASVNKPINPLIGEIYFDQKTNYIQTYDGSNWITITKSNDLVEQLNEILIQYEYYLTKNEELNVYTVSDNIGYVLLQCEEDELEKSIFELIDEYHKPKNLITTSFKCKLIFNLIDDLNLDINKFYFDNDIITLITDRNDIVEMKIRLEFHKQLDKYNPFEMQLDESSDHNKITYNKCIFMEFEQSDKLTIKIKV